MPAALCHNQTVANVTACGFLACWPLFHYLSGEILDGGSHRQVSGEVAVVAED